jgi:hypothetical protein
MLRVIDRRRIELADPAVPGFPQPYHAAEALPIQQAEQLVGRCLEVSRRKAAESLLDAVEDLHSNGYDAAACGVLVRTGRPLPGLEEILASHALLHTAEGHMFRDALCHGASNLALSTERVEERDVYDYAARRLGMSVQALQSRLAELGRELGPPWREDQKLAVIAAWVALRASSGKNASACVTL